MLRLQNAAIKYRLVMLNSFQHLYNCKDPDPEYSGQDDDRLRDLPSTVANILKNDVII
jgi:hypothetical protein